MKFMICNMQGPACSVTPNRLTYARRPNVNNNDKAQNRACQRNSLVCEDNFLVNEVSNTRTSLLIYEHDPLANQVGNTYVFVGGQTHVVHDDDEINKAQTLHVRTMRECGNANKKLSNTHACKEEEERALLLNRNIEILAGAFSSKKLVLKY